MLAWMLNETQTLFRTHLWNISKQVWSEIEYPSHGDAPTTYETFEPLAGVTLFEESGKDHLQEEQFQRELAHGRVWAERQVKADKFEICTNNSRCFNN